MEDKDSIIKRLEAKIRMLENERKHYKARAEHAENENHKLYARTLWQRVFNMIPE
jgi:hypothetical protein